MTWSHKIVKTAPRADNPLNLEVTVEWTNSDTGEVLITRAWATDIDKSIKSYLRGVMNKDLPNRDAAFVAMTALDGQTLDLTLTPDEQAAIDAKAAEKAKLLKLAALQSETQLVGLKVKDETDQAYIDALAAAKAALVP